MQQPEGFMKFKAYLVEHGIKQSEIARMLGITRSALNQKIHRKGNNFTIQEVSVICKTLGISMDEYFFIDIVPKVGKQKSS